MDAQSIFQRYEVKYLITTRQKQILLDNLHNELEHDAYPFGSIRNLYYDTPSSILARHSIEKPLYKEKLRVRSYGEAREDGKVFVELKKKYKSVVYKRRIIMHEDDAMRYLEGGESDHSQISKEIDYMLQFYGNLQPKVFLSYDREAFRGVKGDIRLTFDENILYREDDLNLCSKNYGKPILPDGKVLMELKVGNAIPLYFTRLLSEMHIFKTSFSKYGTAYEDIMQRECFHTASIGDKVGADAREARYA